MLAKVWAVIIRFCPETTLFHNPGVNRQLYLCGVNYYASVQDLDSLGLAKNCSFPNQKLAAWPAGFPDGR
jgi:hypothetical protein